MLCRDSVSLIANFMPRKPLRNFDADWYSATYPDVALSGLSPQEHYGRFGRLLGRPGSGTLRPVQTTPARMSTTKPIVASRPAVATAEERSMRSSVAPGLATLPDPIIDRPSDLPLLLDQLDPTSARQPLELISVHTLADREFADQATSERGRRALSAYVRLVGREEGEPFGARPFADAFFRAGPSRIGNAWFAAPMVLRLLVSGGTDELPLPKGAAFRAYQALPDSPDMLHAVVAGRVLPGSGPAICDVNLVHPLMPLLFVLEAADEQVLGLAIVPFPSLLPGGLHGAELRALQTEFNPIDDFWTMSDILLSEMLAGPARSSRSITSLRVIGSGTSSPSSVISPEMCQWLETIFGLEISSGGPGPEAPGEGLRLSLPFDFLPTISGLASRRLHTGKKKRSTPPFLVAESQNLRPRWSVSLPLSFDAGNSVPVLEQPTNGRSNEVSAQVAVPLAIAVRAPAMPIAKREANLEDVSIGSTLSPTTIVIDAADTQLTKDLIAGVKEAWRESAGQIIVRATCDTRSLIPVLDDAFGPGGWAFDASDADLRDIARRSQHEQVLTISDRLKTDDLKAVRELQRLLNSDPHVASAGCLLLHEVSIHKQRVMQPASGGLFPSRIAFDASPRLAFSEPDVSEALRSMAYPVVANTLFCTLWRTSALADLQRPHAPVPDGAMDIHLGLDLIEKGHRNLCTTKVAVRIKEPYHRREVIDPVGETYVGSARWQHILDRVTVVRDLY